MRTIFFITVINLLPMVIHSQNFNLEWAKSMGSTDQDIGYSIVTDDSSYVYTTGGFKSTVDFDPGQNSNNLSSEGGFDIFVQKLDEHGNIIWAKSFGGSGDDIGNSIALDSAGYIYITGTFRDTVDFDKNVPAAKMISKGWDDVFILKLDPYGNYNWVKSLGQRSSDAGFSIATNGTDKVYISGVFRDTLFYDHANPHKYLKSNGSGDAFLINLDAGGNYNWIKGWGGIGYEECRSITVANNGDLVVTGTYGSTVDFDPDTAWASSFYMTAKGNSWDTYVLKLDKNGDFIWAKSVGGPSDESRSSITNDSIGSIYIAGIFQDSADFDPDSLSTFSMYSKGSWDFFVLKLDSSGNFIWAKSVGGLGSDFVKSITVDISGDIYVTGLYQKSVDFDPSAAVYSLTSKGGSTDLFILKLDSNGNFIWAKTMGGYSDDWGESVSVDKLGNVFSTGMFQSIADFDPGMGIFNVTSNGQWDIYVQKLSQCGFVRGTDEIVSCGAYTWVNGTTYLQNNNTATDTFINVNGCDSVSTLNLIISNVDVSTKSTDSTITANAINAQFQWLDCDNNTILPGDTNQSFTATKNGKYAVIVTQNGCTDTSECVEIKTIGIRENSIFNEVSVFPNPFDNIVNIDLGSLKNVKLRVFDVNERLVYSEESISGCHRFELKVEPGIYVLELNQDGVRERIRLVRK